MKENQFRRKDGVPEGFTLIYKAPMEYYLTSCKNITTICSVVLGAMVVYNYSHLFELIGIPSTDEFEMYGLISCEQDVFFFIFAFTAMTLAIRVFISKYPLRIYRKADQYLAVYDSQLPLKYTHLQFARGQVTAAEPFLLNPWKRETYKIKDYTSVLLIDYFKTPSELFQMLKGE